MNYEQLWNYVYGDSREKQRAPNEVIERLNSIMPKWKGDVKFGLPNRNFPGKTLIMLIGIDEVAKVEFACSFSDDSIIVDYREGGELEQTVKDKLEESRTIILNGMFYEFPKRIIAISALSHYFDSVIGVYFDINAIKQSGVKVGETAVGFDEIYMR